MNPSLPFALVLALPTLLFASGAQADDYLSRMAGEHAGDRPVASPMTTESGGDATVEATTVQYATVDGAAVNGYFARPKDRPHAPGLIVIHEWWGLNDNIRMMADKFAGLGYQALAVDLYGGKSTDTPDGAMALVKQVGAAPQAALANLEQAYTFLAEKMKTPRVGVIGWCFGGGWSMQTALLLPDKIDATVIYYGRLVTDPAKLEPVKGPILGFFGGLDTSIPQSDIDAFQATLKKLGKSVEVHVYPDAHHAFANPSGTRYNAAAADDAWKHTVSFLNEHLEPAG